MIQELPKELLKIIKSGENAQVEFKKASNKIPDNLFDTICAMLNRLGGHIFLGVDDNKKILGIEKNKIKKMQKEFSNLCNNPEKIYPTVRLEMIPYNYDDKIILYINVYEGENVYSSGKKVFDRNEDGDYDISKNRFLMSRLYLRKSDFNVEDKVYPYVTLDNLRTDLIDRLKRSVLSKDKNHPFKDMDYLDILKSLKLYSKDPITGEVGFNLACILLFGTDDIIYEVIPYYKTDALLRVKDIDRYDDRDYIQTNLIDSYTRLMDFVKKHTNDKFYLEGVYRVSPRDIFAREIIINMLMHRDYSSGATSRLIITKDSLIAENASIPKTDGYIDLKNYEPYTKNPKIARVFKELDLSDELGSGLKKINKYSIAYSNESPKLKDGDMFRVVIPLEEHSINIKLKGFKLDLYNFIKNNNGVSRKEINEYMYPLFNNLEEKQINNKIENMIDNLKRNHLIKNIGNKKSPIWLANKKTE